MIYLHSIFLEYSFNKYACMPLLTYSHTHTLTHTLTHMYMYVHTHTHTHTHTLLCCVDDRFIMKHIKPIEISSFEQFAPHYLEHVNKALEEKVGELYMYM